MALLRRIFVVYCAIVISVNGFLDYHIIKAYFSNNFINYATIIGCFSNKEHLRITKKFTFQPMISFVKINKIIERNFLESQNHLAVILDGDCNEARDFLKFSGTLNYFDEKHHWLILMSTKNVTHLFENVEMYVNSNIQVVYPDENDKYLKNYTILEVYNPCYRTGGLVKLYNVGFYNILHGYDIRREECKYWMRRNMTGVTLKTIVVLPNQFEGTFLDHLSSDDNREINTFNRFHFNLLSACQRYYNFTVEVNMSISYGYKEIDGSFNGLVGALERKEVDYGSSPIFVKTGRMKAIQYGRKTWNFRAAFIFRNPKSTSSIQGFLKPLSFSMWSWTALSSVLLMVFLRVSCLYQKKHIYPGTDTTWSYFILCTVGALCQQGMTIPPHCSSGRIVTLFLFLFSLLIYQFYSASLVSHLLMRPPSQINSVDDILHSDMKVGCEDTLYNRDYFKYTTDIPSRKLYYGKMLEKNNHTNFLPPEKGLNFVRSGKYAFHMEIAIAYPIIRDTFKEKDVCELNEVQLYRAQSLYTIYQKNSPYKEMFDSCLQRLGEVGMITRETLFWHPVKPQCVRSSRSLTFNIGLDDFYPPLIVFGIGMVCSLTILALELYYFSKVQPYKVKGKGLIVYPYLK